jgi:Zn ribbon nucleic-acid-binding protein
MTERRECPKCKVYQDVIKLTRIDDITYEQEFSCGFKNKIKIMPTINENIAIGAKLEMSVKKFRTLTEGPILVSDDSGTSVTSGSIQGTVVNGNLTAGTVTINYNNYNQTIIETNNNTEININLGNILSMVDNNNTYTPEEKAQIKNTLTKITDLISATGSTAAKVTPFIPLLANIFH